jgi:ectoine hydroxylase-related dioxygenase (phytanoyl-CoA dioxygenase family)
LTLLKELEKLKIQIDNYKEIDKAILNENKNNNTDKEKESKKEEINNDDKKDSVLLSRESNIPDIENNRDNFPILGWEMEPGDVVCFHMKTLHGAGGVSVNQNRRRVYVARFMGDDIRYEPKYYSSPIWPELEKELKEGDEMNHSLFPIIFESEK